MSKFLSDGEKAVLLSWLEEHGLENTNFRDFADGVRIAELIKKYFPQLVNLSHYSHRNSIKMKLDNWLRLNKHTLYEIDLYQNSYQLHRLASGNEGTIGKFLYRMMRVLGSVTPPVEEAKQSLKDEVQLVSVTRQKGDRIFLTEEKMVSYALYENKLRQYQLKKCNLAAAKQKIAQLQDVIDKKAKLCGQLSAELEVLSLDRTQRNSNLYRR